MGGWEEYFKSLINSTKEFSIAADEGLVLLQTQKEGNKMSGSILVSIFNDFYPSSTIYPGNTLYPSTIKEALTLND